MSKYLNTKLLLLRRQNFYPAHTDHIPLYQLLIGIIITDVREYCAYEESHIVTGRHSIRDSAGGDFQIPADAEVETKHHCVVYDSCTESLADKESKYALT